MVVVKDWASDRWIYRISDTYKIVKNSHIGYQSLWNHPSLSYFVEAHFEVYENGTASIYCSSSASSATCEVYAR